MWRSYARGSYFVWCSPHISKSGPSPSNQIPPWFHTPRLAWMWCHPDLCCWEWALDFPQDCLLPLEFYLLLQNQNISDFIKAFIDIKTLFSIKEIPHCCYNFEFVSPDLEDLRFNIDLYTSILTSIRMSA
jgi:hypothetical protein